MDKPKKFEDDPKHIYRLYTKYPFLVTKDTFKEFGLDKTDRDDPSHQFDVKPKKRIYIFSIEERMAQKKPDFGPPRNPVTCCRRNPISAHGPQDHLHTDAFLAERHLPPSSTYRETIGRTGQEIFKAMKQYQLEKAKKAAAESTRF